MIGLVAAVVNPSGQLGAQYNTGGSDPGHAWDPDPNFDPGSGFSYQDSVRAPSLTTMKLVGAVVVGAGIVALLVLATKSSTAAHIHAHVDSD